MKASPVTGFATIPWFRIGTAGFVVIFIYIVYNGFLPTGTNSDYAYVPISLVMQGNLVELEQNDPIIQNYIWNQNYLQEPSTLPYNLDKPDFDPSMGQGQMVRKILHEMRDGFFVECGALDGETRSNSLYLEKELGWKGLLIEGDPRNYEMVVKKNRKAWTSNTCLATKSHPHEVIFKQQFNIGKISEADPKSFKTGNNHARVQCFPLYSLLSALDVNTVDYFSLDVEGNELDVLLNIPFDDLFIKVLSVEFNHVEAGKEAVKGFMESKGYVVAGEVTNPQGLANDFIFVHRSLQQQIPASL